MSSDSHAWLRPIYARLRADSAFALLGPSHQFEALRQAAADEAPVKAAEMAEWTPCAQHSLLGSLADLLAQQPHPTHDVELWRVWKGARALWCVAVYLPSGIDVRLLESDGFRRTQLVKDALAVQELAQQWREALTARGWRS